VWWAGVGWSDWIGLVEGLRPAAMAFPAIGWCWLAGAGWCWRWLGWVGCVGCVDWVDCVGAGCLAGTCHPPARPLPLLASSTIYKQSAIYTLHSAQPT
jgi:hypothetical protein